VGAGGEMTQALYAHMNNKTIKKKSSSYSQLHSDSGDVHSTAGGEGPT
jgi:hypothetical protein